MKNLVGEEMPKITLETKEGRSVYEFNYIDPSVIDYFQVFVGLLAQQGWSSDDIMQDIKMHLADFNEEEQEEI